MIQAPHFLSHCVFIIFGTVFLDQMGLPFPAVPWLLAAGAVAASEKWRFGVGLIVVVVACLIADAIWFFLGRYRGIQVLRLLCRFSLEPDSCVRATQNLFQKYGLRGVVAAKFLPGMSTLAPPLAGLSGMTAGRFLLMDSMGAVLYGTCFLGLGYCFNAQIAHISAALTQTEGGFVLLIIVPTTVFLAYRYWQRRSLLRRLPTSRMTAEELHHRLGTDLRLVLLDVRSSAALRQDPVLIKGATHLSIDDIERSDFELPLDREVVVYCSCPNEVSSAQFALRLQRKGLTHVTTLLGGIDAWRAHNYPLEPWASAPEAGIEKDPVTAGLNAINRTANPSFGDCTSKRVKTEKPLK